MLIIFYSVWYVDMSLTKLYIYIQNKIIQLGFYLKLNRIWFLYNIFSRIYYNGKYLDKKTLLIWWNLSDFLPYIKDKEKILKLKMGLDKESTELIDLILSRIHLIQISDTIKRKDMYSDKDILLQKKMKTFKKLPYRIKNYDPNVFFFKHGIDFIPWIKRNTSNKSILDCWAYNWDSAIMFLYHLNPKNIFAFEPEPNNFIKLQETIKKNELENRIIPIMKWVWRKEEIINISNGWEASKITKEWWTETELISIDSFCKDKKIIPWLIKRDIEWLEYESVLWAKETIIRNKPILIISIYHNAKDFFEIKPLLESRNIGYKFMIKKCSYHPFIETVLIAY